MDIYVPKPFANLTTARIGSQDCQLAAEGPYCEKIRKLATKYPNLARFDINSVVQPDVLSRRRPNVRTAVFDLSENGECSHKQFHSIDETRTRLHQNIRPVDSCVREVWLLEGLDPNYVALFGEALEVDPRVFHRHSNTSLWQWRHNAGCTPMLPSELDCTHSFQLQYRELRFFPEGVDRFRLHCATSNRFIGTTSFDGKFDQIGTVERRITFWARDLPHGGWRGLIIVDEPVEEVIFRSKTEARRIRLANDPFQGGYPDFVHYSTLKEAIEAPSPPRSSMYDDLCHYFQHHSSRLQITEKPSSAVSFLPKIVASHHVLLLEHTRGLLNYLERVLLARADLGSSVLDCKTDDLWTNIHVYGRRCHQYQTTIDENMMQLQVHYRSRTRNTDQSVIENYESLQEQFRDLRNQAGSLVNSTISISAILDNKRNINESRSVFRLTILGAIFLPLSFTTGLFSMASEYLPGGPNFRIYWAVALSIIAALFVIPFSLGLLIQKVSAPKKRPKVASVPYTVPERLPT